MTMLRLFLLTAMLAGCGQKGPLYFDTPVPPVAQPREVLANDPREHEEQDKRDEQEEPPANND